MTGVALRAVKRVRDLVSTTLPTAGRRGGRRHPVVAAAMALPLALLLAVACGGWHTVVLQASSVAGVMGR